MTDRSFEIKYHPTHFETAPICFIPAASHGEAAMDLTIPRMNISSNIVQLPSTGVESASGMSFASSASYFLETQFKIEIEDEELNDDRNSDVSNIVEDEPNLEEKPASDFQDIPTDKVSIIKILTRYHQLSIPKYVYFRSSNFPISYTFNFYMLNV